MSMRAALTETRQYITTQLMEVISDNSMCNDEGVPDRETTDPDAEPWILEAEQVLAVIDAALSADRTDAECTAALEVWFSHFSDVTRRQMSTHCTLVNRMRRALIAARNAEHVG